MTAPTISTDIVTSSEDPFGPEVLHDPLPFQARLREAGPVVYLPTYNVYAMGRYSDVHAALTDWQTFECSAGVGLSNFRKEKPWRPPSLLLEADPPFHNAPRAVLSKILGARQLHTLQAQWATDADDVVDALVSSTLEFDAVPALAEAFPLRVFPDAVGIPHEGRERLLPYGDHLFNAFGPENALVQRGAGTIGEISGWVNDQCARNVLTPGGFGAEIWAAADRGDISHEQAPTIVRSLLSAGVDTTVHALAAVLYALASNSEQWVLLQSDPNLARRAFDEAIRLESPVQTFFRTTTRDIRVGGTLIPQGEKILMFLGSANRDERRWQNPDAFDLTRDPSGHVGFGMGIHQCVGQHVARLEAATVMAALLKRVKTIEVNGPVTRHLNNTLRAWESLPMRVTLK
ncbi:cytochrome P450 [Cryobacterium melibiosiphilum]|uniref:cytochrome P450 n=1 Tax=Cryobacterium melibiosiphilum TaxID=995039 RepID=UPI0018F3E38E|nr:cytochrome P450 [Cryobacterium melibiosiphilum]